METSSAQRAARRRHPSIARCLRVRRRSGENRMTRLAPRRSGRIIRPSEEEASRQEAGEPVHAFSDLSAAPLRVVEERIGAVAIESLDHRLRQLPRVLDPGVHALSAHRAGDVRRVAGQDDPAGREARAHPAMGDGTRSAAPSGTRCRRGSPPRRPHAARAVRILVAKREDQSSQPAGRHPDSDGEARAAS